MGVPSEADTVLCLRFGRRSQTRALARSAISRRLEQIGSRGSGREKSGDVRGSASRAKDPPAGRRSIGMDDNQTVEHPIAEGAAGDQFFVAYRERCGGVSVNAYAFKKTPEQKTKGGATIAAGLALGECLWSGCLRDGKWSGIIGRPGTKALSIAEAWIKKNTEVK